MAERVPEEHRADIAAYVAMRQRHGIEIYDDPDLWIERVVINTELDVAGTADRFVTMPGRSLPLVLDVKTGANVIRYSQVEIGAQLATYARASHWWAGGLHPMPPVDQEVGLVAWMPAGQGRCDLYEVDLQEGWSIAQACAGVREYRSLRPLTPAALWPTPDEPADDGGLLARRVDWLRARIRALTPPARVEAGKTWPPDTPRKAEHITSSSQVDAIARHLSAVEAAHQLPFPDPDPRDEIDRKPEQEATPVTEPGPDPAVTWTERGKALLALLDDEPLARACAETAGCAQVRMTERHYLALQAVVTQVSDPAGVIRADWRGPTPEIVVVDQAEQIMAQAHGGTKRAAFDAARRAARAFGLPAPRSLSDAAQSPLLAALVASDTTTSSSHTRHESEQP